jgi:hypothetical protein
MSIEFTAHILSLPHERKIRHWASWNPWRFRGKNVRLPGGPTLTTRDVTVSAAGAVTRIARLVERPCFGSPTAFVSHGGDRWHTTRSGETFPSRCNSKNCPAAEACAYVAKRRLRASDSIAAAYDAFEEAGGLAEKNRERKHGRVGRAGHARGRLLRAFDDHGQFDCINTERLRERVATRLADAKRKDAEAKKASRLAARQARLLTGADDEHFLKQLLFETNLRALLFEAARGRTDAPAWIARCPRVPRVSTADVWRAKMLVLSRGQEATPGKVTRQLVNDGLIEPEREHAQRNGAIKAALDRVHRLETVSWNGAGPVWDRTTVEALLEESAEAATPPVLLAPLLQPPTDPLQMAV